MSQQEKNINLMLFLVTFEITNGESQYYEERIIIARDEDEMETKALTWIREFWGDETRIDKNNKYLCWNPDETESIAFDGAERIHGISDVVRKLVVGGDFEKWETDAMTRGHRDTN